MERFLEVAIKQSLLKSQELVIFKLTRQAHRQLSEIGVSTPIIQRGIDIALKESHFFSFYQ